MAAARASLSFPEGQAASSTVHACCKGSAVLKQPCMQPSNVHRTQCHLPCLRAGRCWAPVQGAPCQSWRACVGRSSLLVAAAGWPWGLHAARLTNVPTSGFTLTTGGASAGQTAAGLKSSRQDFVKEPAGTLPAAAAQVAICVLQGTHVAGRVRNARTCCGWTRRAGWWGIRGSFLGAACACLAWGPEHPCLSAALVQAATGPA